MNILLLEDRVNRMKQFVDFNLESYSCIDLIRGDDLNNKLLKINENEFTDFNIYDCLIFHSSAISARQKSNLKTYCKQEGKNLVFFSGGITTSYYTDNQHPFLNVNSKLFYSKNLQMFLDDAIEKGICNLLMIQYGFKWQLNLLLNYRNNINMIKEENEGNKVYVRELETNELILQNIKLDWLKLGNHIISSDEFEDLKKKINTLIFESISSYE